MRWYRKLYLGPNAACNIQKIRRKAALGTVMPGVYYITLASSEENLLDIFHNGMVHEKLFRELQCLDVVGVAEGKQEAFRLTEEILGHVYRETSGFDVRAYFRAEDFEED